MAVVETHTETAKKKLVDAVHEDLDKANQHLLKAREILGALVIDGKGVDDGLVTSCNGWGTHLDQMMLNLDDESKAVEKRMLGTVRKVDHEQVDLAHTEKVVMAKAGLKEGE